MKYNLKNFFSCLGQIKFFVLPFLFFFFSLPVSAITVLSDDFDYPIGDNLEDHGSWSRYGGTSWVVSETLSNVIYSSGQSIAIAPISNLTQNDFKVTFHAMKYGSINTQNFLLSFGNYSDNNFTNLSYLVLPLQYDTFHKYVFSCTAGIPKLTQDLIEIDIDIYSNVLCDFTSDTIQISPATAGYIDAGILLDDILIESGKSQDELWIEEKFTLSSTQPDYYTPIKDVCFVGKDCNITVYYNDLALGKNIRFNYFEEILATTSLATSTLINQYPNEQVVVIPSQSEIETKTYCTNLYGSGLSYQPFDCDSQIVWVNESDYIIDFESEYEDPCLAITPSNESALDDFRYAFECGAKRAIQWAFVPKSESLQKLFIAKDEMMVSFPFSLLTDTLSIIRTSSQATSTMLTYGDFINNPSYQNSSYSMLDTSVISSNLGSVWNDKIFPLFKYLIWLFVFIRVMKKLKFVFVIEEQTTIEKI